MSPALRIDETRAAAKSKPHGTSSLDTQRHPPDLWRHAAARRRGADRRARRSHLPRRPQRLGQIDAAQNRGRHDPARHAASASPIPAPPFAICRRKPTSTGFTTTRAYVEAGLGPTDDPYQAQALLDELGMTGDEDPDSLSGGEARRAALARVLVVKARRAAARRADQPSRFAGHRVARSRIEVDALGAIVLISHDRRFLENLSRATVWIDRGTARRLEQGFAAFEDWRDKVLEEEEIERHKLDRKIVRENDWMHGGVTGPAQTQRPPRPRTARGHAPATSASSATSPATCGSTSAEGGTSGKLVAETKHMSKDFGGRPIVKDLSLRIMRGDRLGLVGPNGAGKTTLIKLLTGALEPDGGTIRLGTNLELVSLDQRRDELDPELDRGRGPDRRARRSGRDQRQGAPCRQLHEGFPVPARAARARRCACCRAANGRG